MPDDEDIKQVPSEGNITGTVQRLLDGEDPTDKELYEHQQTTRTFSDSESLWWDVLELAVDDYKENIYAVHTPGKNIFIEVFDWFFNEHFDRVHLGSFENICLTLDINPSVVRKRLVLWTQDVYVKKQMTSVSPEENVEQKTTITLYVNRKDVI